MKNLKILAACIGLLLFAAYAEPQDGAWVREYGEYNVQLIWKANHARDNVTGYLIYERGINTEYDYNAPVWNGVGIPYEDEDFPDANVSSDAIGPYAANGVIHYFVVRAVNTVGVSSNSDEVFAEKTILIQHPPAAPTGVTTILLMVVEGQSRIEVNINPQQGEE